MIASARKRTVTDNHRLRRADWRFLLPSPHPARSVCFAGGLLAAAVDAISAEVVDPAQVGAATCDLAVAVDPDPATLGAAWAALRPGASCYVEWYSPRAGGVNGVRRRMQKAGFDAVTAYWPWPWPDRSPSAFWLPLEASGALRYFLHARQPAPRMGQRMQAALLRWGWRLTRRVELTLPICVTARKRESGADLGASPPSVLDRVGAAWAAWGVGPRPNELSWLLLTGGQQPVNKVVGLVFAEPDPQPRMAVKLARVPESIPALAHEAAVLGSLHASRPGGVAGAPRLLFYEEGADQTLLGESVLSGAPLYTCLRRQTLRELALQGTAWLVNLAGDSPPNRRWWGRVAEPALDEFARAFGGVVDPTLLRRTRSILAGVGDLPPVCEQRDFSPWNVLISPAGEWAVLDWESAELEGAPGLDLLYFLSYLSFFVDGAMDSGRFLESYRAMLDPATLTGAVFAECWSIYEQQLGLDPVRLAALRPLAWMIHACSTYRQRVREGADPRRRNLFVELWQEELRRGAFDES